MVFAFQVQGESLAVTGTGDPVLETLLWCHCSALQRSWDQLMMAATDDWSMLLLYSRTWHCQQSWQPVAHGNPMCAAVQWALGSNELGESKRF